MNNNNKCGFQDAFDNLPYKYRNAVRIKIMERLGISIATFNNKKAGRTEIRKTELPVIKSVFMRYGVEL